MVEQLFSKFSDIFIQWTSPLVELTTAPSQRLYWPFLLLSLLVATLYTTLLQKNLRLKDQLRMVFSRKGFFHQSSLLDLKLLAFNTALKVFIFPLFIFSMFSVSTQVIQWGHKLFPGFTPMSFSSLTNLTNLTNLTKSILATAMAFLISDFLRFFFHYLMHRIPALRNIHRTHHTAKVLTPFTLFRVHPLEALIGTMRGVLTQGIFVGLYVFLLGGKISLLDILGVNAFGLLFNAFGSNLRHMPIPISFGIFEYIFISPRMHQIHHSSKGVHQNKNHGVALSIWDMLFGTFYRPSREDMSSIQYGITSQSNAYFEIEATQFRAALLQPINLNKFTNKLKGVQNEKSIDCTIRA